MICRNGMTEEEMPLYAMVDAIHDLHQARNEVVEAKERVRRANLKLCNIAVELGLEQKHIVNGASASDFVNGYLYGKSFQPKRS